MVSVPKLADINAINGDPANWQIIEKRHVVRNLLIQGTYIDYSLRYCHNFVHKFLFSY